MGNYTHWYDGWIYDRFIAPNQKNIYEIISGLIEPGSSLLDVGCGTGRLSTSFAFKCGRIIGIDLSSKNILRANRNKEKLKISNINFINDSALNLPGITKEKFDYAVMSFMIHEVTEELRSDIIDAVKQVSEKIIFADYLVPVPNGVWSKINRTVEFAAGREHYAGFKSYLKNGGLVELIEKNNLNILKEFKNKPLTSHILLTEKKV